MEDMSSIYKRQVILSLAVLGCYTQKIADLQAHNVSQCKTSHSDTIKAPSEYIYLSTKSTIEIYLTKIL